MLTRHLRPATLVEALEFDAIGPSTRVGAPLRIRRGEGGLKMLVNNFSIAAAAMTLGVPVVTPRHHYVEIGGLSIIRGTRYLAARRLIASAVATVRAGITAELPPAPKFR